MKNSPYIIDEFNLELHKAADILDKRADEVLQSEFSISLPQFKVLLAIVWKNDIKQIEIARMYGHTTAAIGRIINVLINEKLITRTVNKNNRREHILSITKKGDKLAQNALKKIYALSELVHKKLNTRNYKLLVNTLKDLTQSLSK